MTIKSIRIFGIRVFSVESDDEETQGCDYTTSGHPVGFVRDDLPIQHVVPEEIDRA